MSISFKIIYGLFCLAICFAVWLIAYGTILWSVYKDPSILTLTLSVRPLLALEQLMAYSSNRTLLSVAGLALFPAVGVALIVGVVGLRQRKNPLGDASFQTVPELRLGKWFKKSGHVFGVIGGKYLRVNDDRHHLVIGPTRSGKGAGYVIPNALLHKGSMIVTDLKGEVYAATAGYRKSQGNQVFLFSPGAAQTHRYNPLDFVRQDRGTRTTDIQNIAAILVPEKSESENAIWQATAQQVVAGIISYMLESPLYEGRRNLGEVNSLLNCGINLQELMKKIQLAEPYLSRFTTESFNTYLALSERAAASALIDIQKAMRPFKNERIVAATSVTDLNLAGLQHRPVSIYLAPSITDISLLKPLLTLFIQQTIDLLTRTLQPNPVPVLFLLDEFRQLKRVDEVMNKLPYVAGYKIKMAFIIQDLKNLDEIYGETARHSLLGNCGYQLVLGANDQATADYVSKALGKQTIRYSSESRTIEMMGLNRRTRIEQIRDRDLMMPQEVRQLPQSDMVLLVEGQKPVRAHKIRFFDMNPFKAAAAFGTSNRPDVPHVDILEPLRVPATLPDYGKQPEEKSEASSPVDAAQPAIVPPTSELDGAIVQARTEPADTTVGVPTPPKSKKRSSMPKKRRAPAGDQVRTLLPSAAPATVLKRNSAETVEQLQRVVERAATAAAAIGDATLHRVGHRQRRAVRELFAEALLDSEPARSSERGSTDQPPTP